MLSRVWVVLVRLSLLLSRCSRCVVGVSWFRVCCCRTLCRRLWRLWGILMLCRVNCRVLIIMCRVRLRIGRRRRLIGSLIGRWRMRVCVCVLFMGLVMLIGLVLLNGRTLCVYGLWLCLLVYRCCVVGWLWRSRLCWIGHVWCRTFVLSCRWYFLLLLFRLCR